MKLLVALLFTLFYFAQGDYRASINPYSLADPGNPTTVFALNENVYFIAHVETQGETLIDLVAKGFKVRLWEATWIQFFDNIQYYESAEHVELFTLIDEANQNINLGLRLAPEIFPVPENTVKTLNFSLRVEFDTDLRTNEKVEVSCLLDITNFLTTSTTGVTPTEFPTTETATTGTPTTGTPTTETSSNDTSFTGTPTSTSATETPTSTSATGTPTSTSATGTPTSTSATSPGNSTEVTSTPSTNNSTDGTVSGTSLTGPSTQTTTVASSSTATPQSSTSLPPTPVPTDDVVSGANVIYIYVSMILVSMILLN